MKGLAAVVVLYYPDESELLRNIRSYLGQTAVLYAIDNTPDAATRSATQQLLAQLQDDRLQYLPNDRNEGIAAALNKAARMAIAKDCSWLLTMDQDSYFDEQAIRQYTECLSTVFDQQPATAIVAPAINTPAGETAVYSKVVSVITSGSMIRLSTWEQLGGFDEKLFIDEVDHEYCYRVQAQGYEVIQLTQVVLHHQLGRKKTSGYFGTIARRNRTIHSPLRVYFMVRNYLYVRKQYRKLFPGEFNTRDRQLKVALKNNLLFSGNFSSNFSSILKGYRDYKKNVFPNPA